MARLGLTMPCVAAVVAVLALAGGAAAQGMMAPAPAPASGDCSAALAGLMGCLTYVAPGSAQSRPPRDCCAGVKGSVSSPASVACLCKAFGTDYGVPINLTRAAGLPAACGEDPATFKSCNIHVPGAPVQAPAPSSGSMPAPGPSKSAASRSPVSAIAVLAVVAAPLLSYYYL
ncbi:hypothetical protein ACP70R_005341 [Stipagrostis hirtigluma subsp. patula]